MSYPQSPASRSALPETRLWPLVMVLAAWWLLTRPYPGIFHDGVLYTAQALKRLHPGQYAQDIFFLYGSQDDFTIIGVIHAWLIGHLGMDAAFMALTLAGAILWSYALLWLLRRWLSVLPLAAALILALSADPHYGGLDVFSYGERFATPRVFSEALVLLALSTWLEGKRVLAGCFLAGAVLLHPLIALAGVGILAWASLQAWVGRPLILGLSLLVASLLGMQLALWLGAPWLDPVWKQFVEQRSPFLFAHLWNPGDWLRLSLDATLLWLASRHVPDEAGKVAGWVLPVLVLAMLLAIAAETMGVQWAVAAQLQRVQWLAHLLALALAVPLCLGLWREAGGRGRYLAAGVAGSLVFPVNLGGLVLPVVYGMHAWAGRRLPNAAPGPRLSLALLAAVPGAGLALWLFYFSSSLIFAGAIDERPAWLWVFIQAPVALGVLFAGYALARRVRLDAAWLWVYAACVLSIGIYHWDQRKPWNAEHDHLQRMAAIAPAQAMIPEGAVVYWESGVFVSEENRTRLDKGLERAWFWLRRSNYASFDQAAGSVFYRKTAMESARRAAHLRRWGFGDGNVDWAARKKPPRKFPLSMARLQGICMDPVLDFVITDTNMPEAKLGFQDPLTGRKFSVYDCQPLRQGASENGARRDA